VLTAVSTAIHGGEAAVNDANQPRGFLRRLISLVRKYIAD